MIITKLMGGLGNQMFQYAFGRFLAHKHHTDLKLDIQFLQDRTPRKGFQVFRNYDLDIFNVKGSFASKEEVFRLSRRHRSDFIEKASNRAFGLKKSYLAEPHFHFSKKAFEAPDNVYIAGYWQSEKYFAPIEPTIRSDFTYKTDLCLPAKEVLREINNANSVCVNVRRGDFVVNKFHGSYGVDYFQKAQKILEEKISDPRYFIFSDDMDWCRENLGFLSPGVFVAHDYAGYKFQDYLRLMAACKHYIIPNSSFAWWAVWFNQNTDRVVIAPKIWFNDDRFDTSDLIPSHWIRI
jgi:hypothetical protein